MLDYVTALCSFVSTLYMWYTDESLRLGKASGNTVDGIFEWTGHQVLNSWIGTQSPRLCFYGRTGHLQYFPSTLSPGKRGQRR